jgi:multiple sugar transport system permease protein
VTRVSPSLTWRRFARGRLFDPEHPMPPGPMGTFIAMGVLVALGVLITIPMYWMVVTALTPSGMLATFPPDLIPSNPTLRNFEEILQRRYFWNWVFNSTVMAVVITAGVLVIGSMAGTRSRRSRSRARGRCSGCTSSP